MRQRAGFTIIEICISLLVMAIAVITVAMFLTSALQRQQEAQDRMAGAMAAQMLMEAFSAPKNMMDGDRAIDVGGSSWGYTNRGRLRGEKVGENCGWKDLAWTSEWKAALVAQMMERQVFGSEGMPDLERVLANAVEGLLPLPPDIARRLESENDEIRRHIDAGGQLFYIDPYFPRGSMAGMTRHGAQRNTVDGMQRLIIGVLGNPQQNLLPYHPAQTPLYMTYPFPPQVSTPVRKHSTGDSGNSFSPKSSPRAWSNDGALYLSDLYRPTVSATALQNGTARAMGGTLRSGTHWPDNYGRNVGWGSLPQGNDWEWNAMIDRTVRKVDAGQSPWLAGLAAFRRLARYHWERIAHQTAGVVLKTTKQTGTATVTVGGNPIYDYRTRKYTMYVAVVSNVGEVTLKPEEMEVVERVIVGYTPISTEERDTSSQQGFMCHGIPTPPMGLGNAKGSKGTDILYEDHQALAWRRLGDMRIGMPGLERRVMYRTQALDLWSRVSGYGSLTQADIDSLGPLTVGNPNVLDEAKALKLPWNPLKEVRDPHDAMFAGRKIHPTEILALSYLAHAAMLVTGYKPPFYDAQNDTSPTRNRLLVSDRMTGIPDGSGGVVKSLPQWQLPYKALTPEEYYLWDYTYTGPPADSWSVMCEGYAAGDIVRGDSIALVQLLEVDPAIRSERHPATLPPGTAPRRRTFGSNLIDPATDRRFGARCGQ